MGDEDKTCPAEAVKHLGETSRAFHILGIRDGMRFDIVRSLVPEEARKSMDRVAIMVGRREGSDLRL
jgi:hypothetical protein